MNRKDELLKILGDVDKSVIKPLIDEIIFLEAQLLEIKKLPFINVNPQNPLQQKSTPAAKLYKELLQQYANCIKILWKTSGQSESDEESPLGKWVKAYDLDA